ncbi:MAG: ATP-binding cassette domain-containing protein [Clostridiales bacterium]|nr:ATP-binding cassette domain-containing protein [Clostridiales bacterium]
MISMKNLTKKYGEKAVVDQVNLTLPKGKIIAFIGSNGAGKSTLISMISRVLGRDSGDIFIDGKELTKWKTQELSKRLSILKQSNHLNIRLTIEDLVSFGRFPHSRGRLTEEDIKKVDEAIEYMGLTDLKDRFLDELSGGQRQMAYIAMVIAQDTEYIFLDEPLNNLDMRHSVNIMKIVRKLVDDLGKTVMVVIHDINFVSVYADYVIAMKHGKIVKHGDTCEIINTKVLNQVYDMDISIENIRGKNICLYYS